MPSLLKGEVLVIAQELINFLKDRKGNEGYTVVKIDLEKAYDRLEWSFIRMVLIHFGFPSNIVALIRSCISTRPAYILFNGTKHEPFSPSKGTRQFDPSSLYLFLQCMEFLGSHITKLCEEQHWPKIKVSNGGPCFSHISFADDLMLFAKSNLKYCDALISFFFLIPVVTLLAKKLT